MCEAVSQTTLRRSDTVEGGPETHALEDNTMRVRPSTASAFFYTTIGIGAVMSLSGSALAQADEAMRRCLAEVRQTMISEELKTLHA